MTLSKKKRRGSFFGTLLFIILLGGILLFAGIRIMQDILIAYEASRPEHFMDSYVESFDREHVATIAKTVAYDYDKNIVGTEAYEELYTDSFPYSALFTYKRNGALCTGNKQGYYVLANGDRIGTVVIEQEPMNAVESSDWGLKLVSGKLASILGCSYGTWSVQKEDFYFQSPDAEPVSVTVPETWSVVCNGYTLDDSYITGEPQQIETFADYYADFGLPMLVTYTVDSYLGEVKMEILDAEGEPVTLSDDPEENEQLFVKGFFQNDNERIRTFTSNFLERYIVYTSNANQNRYGNLESLRALIVKDSDLDTRMVEALEGQYFAHTRNCIITEIKINAIIKDEEFWVCDFTYSLDTTGNAGVVSTTHNAKINIVEVGDNLKVSRFISY